MFTVCPKCALTLVVTAADLRVAQGYVRCGRCLNVFNALARLSEERPSAAAAPLPESDESPEQAAPAQPSAPPSMVDDTGEIEIELDASVLAASADAAATPETTPTDEAPPSSPETPAQGEAQPPAAEATEPLREERPEPEASPAEPPPSPPAEEPVAHAQQPPGAAAPAEETELSSTAEAPEAPETGQTNNTPEQAPESSFDLARRRPRASVAWMLGAGALALVLALQILNHYRDALAANPALRGPLSTVYSALGVKLAPRWNIHAYDVRQLGASVAGAAAGQIVVRASVKNSDSRAQPLPLLRVTLQDRFGNRIAARDVPPSDYLPSSVAPGSLLAAGSRVDATMVFVDPGPQAVGFEIDACLRQRGGQVACAHGP